MYFLPFQCFSGCLVLRNAEPSKKSDQPAVRWVLLSVRQHTLGSSNAQEYLRNTFPKASLCICGSNVIFVIPSLLFLFSDVTLRHFCTVNLWVLAEARGVVQPVLGSTKPARCW